MPLQTPPDHATITALRYHVNQADDSVVYEGEVVVRYGSTKVTADRVTAYQGVILKQASGQPSTAIKQIVRGKAEGNVVLVDPSGTVNADRIEFGLDPAHRFETAQNATIRIGNGILHARRAELDPVEWQLFDVEGTTSLQRTPIYYVTSDHVTVSPGKQAVIHQPRVSLLGKFVAELPTQRASLIQAVPGLHYPAPYYKPRRGFGLSANGGLLVGRTDVFSYNSRVFLGQKLGAYTAYTRSFLPLARATQVVPPKSDFAERFSEGFLNKIGNDTPEEEYAYYSAHRSSISIAGQLNGSTRDRDRGAGYSKVEGVYEVGGSRDRIGLLGQIRMQGIAQEGEAMEPRLKLVGAAELPIVNLNPRLQFINRLDTESFLGKTGYGWVQGTSGLSFRATNWLRLSAGGYASADAGTPQFGQDPLYAKGGALLRSDLAVGGLTFTYILKRDIHHGTYDREYAFHQIIGGFELYYIRRQFPNSKSYGITIRVQPFVDTLKRRIAEISGKPLPKSSKH